MHLQVIVSISAGSLQLLGATEGSDDLARRRATAVAYFMAERDPARPGWAYPDFRRQYGDGPRTRCEVAIDGDLWARFRSEAERQRVTSDELLEHALLYLAAGEDSGALAERLGRGLG